jgi:hypothetical protein
MHIQLANGLIYETFLSWYVRKRAEWASISEYSCYRNWKAINLYILAAKKKEFTLEVYPLRFYSWEKMFATCNFEVVL